MWPTKLADIRALRLMRDMHLSRFSPSVGNPPALYGSPVQRVPLLRQRMLGLRGIVVAQQHPQLADCLDVAHGHVLVLAPFAANSAVYIIVQKTACRGDGDFRPVIVNLCGRSGSELDSTCHRRGLLMPRGLERRPGSSHKPPSHTRRPAVWPAGSASPCPTSSGRRPRHPEAQRPTRAQLPPRRRPRLAHAPAECHHAHAHHRR